MAQQSFHRNRRLRHPEIFHKSERQITQQPAALFRGDQNHATCSRPRLSASRLSPSSGEGSWKRLTGASNAWIVRYARTANSDQLEACSPERLVRSSPLNRQIAQDRVQVPGAERRDHRRINDRTGHKVIERLHGHACPPDDFWTTGAGAGENKRQRRLLPRCPASCRWITSAFVTLEPDWPLSGRHQARPPGFHSAHQSWHPPCWNLSPLGFMLPATSQWILYTREQKRHSRGRFRLAPPAAIRGQEIRRV